MKIWRIALGLVLMTAVLTTVVLLLRRSFVRPQFDAEYQAVLLTNGQVYYGHLEGLGTPFPVLTKVFYVQVGVDPQTKETKNVLLKRGKEWHAPDRMVLNASHIILVEPVTPTSKVAALIGQQQ